MARPAPSRFARLPPRLLLRPPLRLAALAIAGLLVAGCATGAGPAGADAGTSRALLLGEVHDNPDGHRQRLELLSREIDAGWRPAIAMEQFDRERQPDLDRAMAACGDADCVIRAAGGGPKAGWDWALYRPVIALALRHRLALVAANVSRADAARVMREGYGAALDAATIAAFGLDRPLPPDLLARHREQIVQGHCGKLPAEMADPMVRAQVARDVWMARVVSERAPGGVALLAGNGHVRTDIGVARWLPASVAGAARSVGFIEGDAAPPFDAVRRIRPLERPDPCAAFTAPRNG